MMVDCGNGAIRLAHSAIAQSLNESLNRQLAIGNGLLSQDSDRISPGGPANGHPRGDH
jgi:hypothetical protein